MRLYGELHRFIPALAAEPMHVRALYLIERYDATGENAPGVTSSQIPRVAALTAMLPHLNAAPFLSPNVMSRLLPTLALIAAEVPVHRLRYPSGFEHQELVFSHVAHEMGWS